MIDLRLLTFLDTAGLFTLLPTHARARGCALELALVRPRGIANRVVTTTMFVKPLSATGRGEGRTALRRAVLTASSRAGIGEAAVPIDVPTLKRPANRGVGTLLAIPRMAKRKRPWEQIPCARFHCQGAVPVRPVVRIRIEGKRAQGDSNSHGPNGPQGPQPFARPPRPVLLPPKRTLGPRTMDDLDLVAQGLCCHGVVTAPS